MASNVNIQGLITGTAIGTEKLGIISLANTISIAASSVVPMSAASATIPVPVTGGTAPLYCLIVPPTTSSIAITYKTNLNSGDTGMAIGSSTATLLSFGATTPTYLSFAFGSTTSTSVINVKFW